MILPTVRDRIVALDVLRGIAVLGILLANIYSFAMPIESGSALGNRPPDRLLDGLTMALVSGKFRSMLAMLFGVGMYLQFVKRSAGDAWPGGYLKRNVFLALIGLAHGFLIWYGDILYIYSLGAFVSCLVVHWLGEAGAKWVAIGFGALVLFGTLALVGLDIAFGGLQEGSGSGPFESLFGAGRELEIFRSGSYLEQLGQRAVIFGLVFVIAPLLIPALVPLMLFGFLLGRSGVLASPSGHPKWRNALLAVGFGIGFPLNLLAGIGVFGSERLADSLPLSEFVLGPLLAMGYLIVGAIWVERGALRTLTRWVQPVGKVALSAYLLQSALCSAIFYSWGLGLFGRVTAWGQIGVVAIVWALVILFAHLWLARFALGPVEWIWRSLTEGRRLPIRREGYAQAA